MAENEEFSYDDLLKIYNRYHNKRGAEIYKYLNEILEEAQKEHEARYEGKDSAQSWKAFKGNNFERLFVHMVREEIESYGLTVIQGSRLGRTEEDNLTDEEREVRRALMVEYGSRGEHKLFPDADIIIYRKQGDEVDVLAVLSVKVSLRERVAQSGYWKLKLASQPQTKHIKMLVITLDEKDLKEGKKSRSIAEHELDGSYVLTKEEVKESATIKLFDKFSADLQKLLNGTDEE